MKSIGTDTLVVFTLLVGLGMETKVTWTSMINDFSPFKRSDSPIRFKFISNGAVERVVREKEWDAKHHVSHSMLVLSPEHMCSRIVQDIVAWVESNVEKLQNRTDDIKRIRDNPVLYR